MSAPTAVVVGVGAERGLAGHTLHLLCMGELLLGEGAKSRPQDFAVEAVLALEVVVDSGLVDPCLGTALRIRSRVMSDGRVIS